MTERWRHLKGEKGERAKMRKCEDENRVGEPEFVDLNMRQFEDEKLFSHALKGLNLNRRSA